MDDRIVSSGFREGEDDQEQSLRPKALRDYIGQESVKQNLRISIEALQTSSPFYFLISPYERIIALALHIALSIIVFTAVKRKKLYLYPVAILLHALVDSVAALYQYGLISSIYLVEGIVTAIVIVVTLYACRIYRSDKYNDPEEPEPSPEVSPE